MSEKEWHFQAFELKYPNTTPEFIEKGFLSPRCPSSNQQQHTCMVFDLIFLSYYIINIFINIFINFLLPQWHFDKQQPATMLSFKGTNLCNR